MINTHRITPASPRPERLIVGKTRVVRIARRIKKIPTRLITSEMRHFSGRRKSKSWSPKKLRRSGPRTGHRAAMPTPCHRTNVRYGSLADITARARHVRSSP